MVNVVTMRFFAAAASQGIAIAKSPRSMPTSDQPARSSPWADAWRRDPVRRMSKRCKHALKLNRHISFPSKFPRHAGKHREIGRCAGEPNVTADIELGRGAQLVR